MIFFRIFFIFYLKLKQFYVIIIKQINKLTLNRYETADNDIYDKCVNIDVDPDPDVRYYACVIDKNRAGAKPTVLFKLNLAYNYWEEVGYLKLKDEFNDLIG